MSKVAKGTAVAYIKMSPLNKEQWLIGLACGHDHWITSQTKPHKKTMFCRTCDHETSLKELEEAKQRVLETKYQVVGVSNGHTWVRAFGFISCRDCGFLRRADGNRRCAGRVAVGPR